MDIKLTIRTKLLFFALVISALPLLLLLSFISFQIRAQTRHTMQESLQGDLLRARGVLEQRADALQGIAHTAAEFAASFNVIEPASPPARVPRTAQRARRATSHTRGQAQAFLHTLLATWKVDFLAVTDAQGRVLFRANKPDDGPKDLSRHLLVSQALERKPATGLVRETPERLAQEGLEAKAGVKRKDDPAGNAGLCLEAAAPVLDSNRTLIGAVLVGELVNNNAGLVDEIRATLYGNRPDTGAVSIYLDDYTVATNFYTGEGRALGVRSDGRSGFKEAEDWFGQRYVTLYDTLMDPKGVAVGKLQVAVKEFWYQQPENQFRIRVLQATVLALLIFLAAAAWVAHRFTRPILEIADASNRISLGELDTSVKAATGDEIEALAEAIERMRLSLRAALARLKKV